MYKNCILTGYHSFVLLFSSAVQLVTQALWARNEVGLGTVTIKTG